MDKIACQNVKTARFSGKIVASFFREGVIGRYHK
jgi:hypothetical protein